MKYKLAFLLLLFAMIRAAPSYGATPLTASDTGACTTAGACYVIAVPANSGASVINVAGTFGATLQFEGCIENCGAAASWVPVNAFPLNSSTAATSTTGTGAWRVTASGITELRVRCSTYGSGIALVAITTSLGSASNGGGGGGSVSPGAQFTPLEYTAANVAGPTPGCTPPASNGMYDLLYNITANTATDISCPLLGLAGTPGLTGAASTYLVAYSDNAQRIAHDKNASSAVAVTLPTPTTLLNPMFFTKYCNSSALTDTITPTTWTINLAASISVPPNTCYNISVDPNNTALTETNWLADPSGPGTSPITPKINNGVSYSNNYPGATVDAQVNAAMTDAAALANGNTSGIVDASASGGTPTITAPITLLTGTRLNTPANCNFHASGFTGGTNSAIVQNNGSSLINFGGRVPGCTISNFSAANGMYAVYQTGNGNYYQDEGVSFGNRDGAGGGNTLASGATCLVGAAEDASYWQDMGCSNYLAGGSALQIGGWGSGVNAPCCGINFVRDTFYDNNSGGVVVDIEGGTYEPREVNFFGGSSGHPGIGFPIIKCNDPSSFRNSNALFFGYYEETNATDTTTTLNQVTGCGHMGFYGFAMAAATSGVSSAAGFSFSNIPNVVADFSDITMYKFTIPTVIVQNNSTDFCPVTPCNVLGNDNGLNDARLGHYTKGRSWADNFTLFASNDIVLTNEGVTGTTLNKLAKLTGAPSTAIIAATTDTNGIVGIVTGYAGTTLSATVAISGQAQCVFSGGTTANDYVGISTATAGDCVDEGVAPPSPPISGVQTIGQITTTHASAGTYWILVYGPAAPTSSLIVSPCSAGLYNGGSAIPSGTYILSAYCYNTFGKTYTITGIQAWSNNSGTSTCNAADNSSNALLTGAITASPSWVAGTQGSTTTIPSAGWVNFTFVSDGASTRVNCVMTTSR